MKNITILLLFISLLIGCKKEEYTDTAGFKGNDPYYGDNLQGSYYVNCTYVYSSTGTTSNKYRNVPLIETKVQGVFKIQGFYNDSNNDRVDTATVVIGTNGVIIAPDFSAVKDYGITTNAYSNISGTISGNKITYRYQVSVDGMSDYTNCNCSGSK